MYVVEVNDVLVTEMAESANTNCCPIKGTPLADIHHVRPLVLCYKAVLENRRPPLYIRDQTGVTICRRILAHNPICRELFNSTTAQCTLVLM